MEKPFVHLCGRRYTDRAEDVTEIKVYSNQPCVTLCMDGKAFASKRGDKVFTFEVPITGEHEIKAVCGELTDSMIIRRVEKENPAYAKPGTQVTNWFDREDEIERAGYFSIKDSMADVKANPAAAKVLDEIMTPLQEKIIAAYGDVARNVQLPPEVLAMMDRMSVEDSIRQLGKLATPEIVHKLNHALNQIKK